MGNHYMRTMIYLRENIDLGQSIGYLRLERKGNYLLFSLVLTGTSMPVHSPIYVVLSNEGKQQSYLIGETSRSEYSEGSILLTQLPPMAWEKDIYGALIGTKGNYLAGNVDCHDDLPKWQEPLCSETETKNTELSAAEETVDVERRQTLTFVQDIFEDDEFTWCKRINPADLSELAMKEWYLVANSFLLQGYYNYHHLLYASDGEKDYLGVPGQYQRRELYMAKRFGFPLFKSKSNKPLQAGDDGYWLREIKKGVKE